jgi:hypothetical protein
MQTQLDINLYTKLTNKKTKSVNGITDFNSPVVSSQI